jgi:tetratricopeptide (TPR) repeat protein
VTIYAILTGKNQRETKAMDYTKAQDLFRKATETANDDPQKALPMVKECLHAFRFFRCYRIRSACMVGMIYSILGNLKRSERIILGAYRVAKDCECCQPILDRHYSLLLTDQKRHSEAIRHATRAVDAKGPDKPLNMLFLGLAYFYAGDKNCVQCLSECIEKLSPKSHYRRAALLTLAAALTFGEGRDLQRVVALLPELEKQYKGVKNAVHERAVFAWVKGGIYSAQAETLKGWERRTVLCSSRKSLGLSYRKFLKHGLAVKAKAVFLDLLAVQARLNKAKIVTRIFEDYDLPKEFEMERVRSLALSKRRDSLGQLMSLLSTLRQGTHAGPALVSYK